MNMDLVVIFSFISVVVLIITAGITLLPITKKLGVYLEEAAFERRENRLSGGSREQRQEYALQAAPPELIETLSRLEQQVASMADRQAFVEELIEKRPAAELRGDSGGA